MGLTKSGELFKWGQGLSAGLEEASCHEFYSCKEMNSANHHLNLEEDPKTQMRPQLTPHYQQDLAWMPDLRNYEIKVSVVRGL